MGDQLEFLVAEQQRELMAAKDIQSDFDYAFHVQVEEALAASLAHHDHYPTSFPPASAPDLEHQDDEISNLIKLQALELERFQQEKRDQEIFESEMSRVSYDLKRRAHDAKLAREINQMPDEDWDEYGDNFERPLGGEGSSSGPRVDEPFRLYFKGLVSTECVSGKLVSLAAVGIAVCDPRDNLIMKVQKPLCSVGNSRAVAEATALIEGLNTVLLLDIKRVHVFVDYVPLYNHVKGRWIAKQRKVVNLITQVYPLQRRFEACQFFLQPRCHVKFAFKLARDAIDSQATKPMLRACDKNLRVSCTICLEETELSQIFVVDGCSHCYCFSCMRQHAEVKLLHGILPVCPHEGCNIKLNVDSSKKFLSPRLIEMMSLRIKEAAIPEPDRLYCPYPKCSALMSKSEMIRPQPDSSLGYHMDKNFGLRKCVLCKGNFCLYCKVPWHTNMSCYDYKRFNPHARAEDAKLHSLAKQRLWRQCLKCNHMIELAEGCFHMTCRCGYEFCYTCGAEWRNKKATCSCPLWEEENILHDDDSDDSFGYAEDDYDTDSDFY